MKQRQAKKVFKKQIQSVIDLVGENLDVICDKKTYYTIYYEIKKDKKRIGFSTKRYIKDYHQHDLPLGISLKEALITSALHEIGHHKDPFFEQKILERNSIQRKINAILFGEIEASKEDERKVFQDEFDAVLPYKIERGQLSLQVEKKAWDIAYRLNETHKLVPTTVFLKLQTVSLSTYEDVVKKVLETYEALEDKKEKQTRILS